MKIDTNYNVAGNHKGSFFDKLAVEGAGIKGDKEGGLRLNADQRIKG